MADPAPTNEIECVARSRSAEFMLHAEVMQHTTLSKTVIWRLIQRGEFPPPVHLSPNRRAWVRSEVEDWVAAKKREREAEPLAA